MKKKIIFFLVFQIFIIGCTTNHYSISKLNEDEKLYNQLIQRRVLITKNNGKKIIGFLKTVEMDSISIYHIGINDRLSERKIATNEIKSIKIKKKANPAVIVGLVSILTIIFLLGSSITDLAISS